MIVRDITINNKSGLHARPASLWVQVAGRYKCSVKIKKGETEVDGKSILGILSLGLGRGSSFQLLVDGADELEAAQSLADLVIDLESQDR